KQSLPAVLRHYLRLNGTPVPIFHHLQLTKTRNSRDHYRWSKFRSLTHYTEKKMFPKLTGIGGRGQRPKL
ncbi:hypothetical protein PspLS_12144, partial [Pyricularia sp. CBS 133598]